MTTLPPYSGDDSVCIKCSNHGARTTYQPAIERVLTEYNGRNERRGPLPERLERCCRRCDFQWDEALNPSSSPIPPPYPRLRLEGQQ